ncbi:MAG: transposase [Planctomycetes bacterium]|nr:transposase [Planctomycetota bacterium]NUQ35755.1 transposase [Planctomycetaceae bacterium]
MGHTYASLNYHLIFSTKDRAPLLDKPLRPRISAYFGGILRELGGEMVSIGGVEDHVHILVRLKPGIPTAKAVGHVLEPLRGYGTVTD